MVNQEFLSSSKRWDWVTPPKLWNKIDPIFNFVLDAAANERDTKCERYIDEETNALTVDWVVGEGEHWFLNPPWGKLYKKATGYTMKDWMRHALEQYEKGYEGVALVSVRTDTKWWHKNVKYAPWVCFPLGRVHYIDPFTGEPATQNTFPSVLVIYINNLSISQILALQDIGDLRKRV